MKLLVCISQTPDTTTKISFKEGATALDSEGVQYIMNPYDEWYALVKALEIKEKCGGTVTLIHVGPAANDGLIRKGLAIGADDAIRIDLEPADSLEVASQIKHAVSENTYDIIFTGKETIEYNSSEVGSMIAEMLNLPFISYATSLDVEGDQAFLIRDAGGNEEKVQLQTPFVLSASKGLAEQRIPNMRGIMTAKTKPLKVVSPTPVTSRISTINYRTVSQRTTCTMIDPDQMDELVRKLHEEAKVI